MNDATELESSLAGTIDFFQNVRRKLGALEAATDSQQTLLQTVTTTVAACEQGQQTDRRALAVLADTFGVQTERLTALQADIRLVDEQLARLASELESQRQTMAEAGPLRQELQKHQDRLKHLDTLITKLSADTSSTRQILNVLQADLATQSDALRELDQTWREGLASYQDRLSELERIAAESKTITPTPMAEEAMVDAAAEESPFLTPPDSPFLVAIPTEASAPPAPQPTTQGQIDQLASAFSVAQEEQQALHDCMTATLAADQEEKQKIHDQLAAAHDRQQALDEQFALLQTALTSQQDALADLRATLTEQLAAQQQHISALATAMDSSDEPAIASLETDLLALRETVNHNAEQLIRIQDALGEQLQDQRQRLDQLDTALNSLSHAAPPTLAADLQPLHAALAEQADALEQLRQDTQQQFTTLTATTGNQAQEIRQTADRTAELQEQMTDLLEQFAALPTPADRPAAQNAEVNLHDFQQNLDVLQGTVAALDTRLAGQAQAFSSNFEQFQGLNTELAELRQQLAKLESARRPGVIEQVLAAQGQEISQLGEALQQIKRDQPEFTETAPDSQDAKITALEEQFNRYNAQQADLAAHLEATRANSKVIQEKVLTLATNVAQRIHEFQNQLLAAKTDQGTQIQTIEQKLITLQATVEALETQRKTRRWFSMPASLTTVLVIVGAVLLAVFNRIIM
ncbi:hypothetical protein BN873_210063 [Candidatus Competibacter denitrificans Run_A_D11]|mgnify:CR=1 FL=1|uniref:Uncharacterized protein n=1 Tax=Candidatus Competibacter denitrificans Run_A_D11 TaxID=1400863 RepID=W6M2U3_9GAMM|nr:hypothetical protein [Candidatus Competibacter denitrificans]CDI01842.1 hypothetical protein BN873_210063 [Candidatus Competibacter denitrificans Run_A_D11]HAS86646.1 hypothetical protein [Candidatus Competibacteraceae bacterium]HRC68068.1 hypothetical protein [Candidatus Competibacter denitrificans]